MTQETQQTYWVTFEKRDGRLTRHVISFTPPGLLPEAPEPRKAEESPENSQLRERGEELLTFDRVIDSFVRDLESYMDFLALTISLAPDISNTIAEIELKSFVERAAIHQYDNADGQVTYELSIETFRELNIRQQQVIAAFHGVARLPEIAIIGLVSLYDAFLGNMLRVIFTKHPEIVLSPDKTISYADLFRSKTIEEVRASLIEKEIENILRDSHHEQFYLIEKKFELKLREGLTVWPDFVELCQRRNLLTHTGGRVSEQYIANCTVHGKIIPKCEPGDRIRVTHNYFAKANEVIYEIGLKMAYVFWRKFFSSEIERADKKINEICYKLIFRRRYSLAESVLKFSCQVLKTYKGSEVIRRMSIINLANTIRLQDRSEEAKKIIKSEDWSASDNAFKLGVAAVMEDIDQVVSLMFVCGNSKYPSTEDYRTWPIFRKIRDDKKFIDAFEKIFGEPLRQTVKIHNSSELDEREN